MMFTIVVDVYYWEKIDELRNLRNDYNYVRFFDTAYANEGRIGVYADQHNKILHAWIEDENVEDEGTSDERSDYVVVVSIMFDDLSFYQEVDDKVIPLKNLVDHFCHI